METVQSVYICNQLHSTRIPTKYTFYTASKIFIFRRLIREETHDS